MNPKCMYPDCESESKSRGLCHNHYMSASSMVRAKKITWGTLEANRKCLPRKRRDQTVKNFWFLSPAPDTGKDCA